MASIFTLGHMGPKELGAAALGSMFATVSAFSVSYGATTALDTLCSQAWTGARDKTLLGIHLQRALLILALIMMPIAFTWWHSESILLLLNQDPELAHLAGAPANVAFEAVKKFLQAQGIMQASTYCLLIASPFNMVLNYTLVYREPFQLGFIGAPLATALSYWLLLGMLILYIKYVQGSEAWGGWSRESLEGWWPFLRLAIPGIFMVCTEWWCFELASLAASYLSTVDLAAQSILITTVSATYCIPFGFSIAAATRVGNALGSRSAKRARAASKMALLFAIALGLLNSVIFITVRSSFGYMFTSKKEVVDRVASILPVCSLFQVADCLAGICGGVVRGLGRQNIAAWINIFAYYIVAMPIALFLTFYMGWGLVGIWTGLSIALFLAAVGECVFLYFIDWDAEVEKAHKRVKQEEDEIHEEATSYV
ncbi:hypothetical protein DFQ28_008889 [Apophysomyces sp. BC1034]|nr:hypothetical protein DFQ29_005776 [Apophysomyces sp. BC1021]KAG0194630.1 hypothetical protein DFQ28_008889 [Apophysomyces sp. BC1034]